MTNAAPKAFIRPSQQQAHTGAAKNTIAGKAVEVQSRSKKINTLLTPNEHKALSILLQIDDMTCEQFLRQQVQRFITGHKHASTVKHLIDED